MFLLYSISGLLGTFLIFAHSHLGREYAFLAGLTIIALLCAYRYEKGYSLSKTMFTCILLPLVGTAVLAFHEYRGAFMDNLDHAVATYVAYQLVFLVAGILATLIHLYKLLVSRLLARRLKVIHNHNHIVTMSGSGDPYLEDGEIRKKERLVRNVAHTAVFAFLLATSLLTLGLPHLGLESEELAVSLIQAGPCICFTACWIFATLYIFNCGFAMICVLAASFAGALALFRLLPGGVSPGEFRELGLMLAWCFIPAVAGFFLRELRILPYFDDL